MAARSKKTPRRVAELEREAKPNAARPSQKKASYPHRFAVGYRYI